MGLHGTGERLTPPGPESLRRHGKPTGAASAGYVRVSESENAPHSDLDGRAPHVRGLVLAAGAGRRMGGPKALIRRHPDEPTLVERAVTAAPRRRLPGITVVVGAAARRSPPS